MGTKVLGETTYPTLSYCPLVPLLVYFLLGVRETGVGVAKANPDLSSAVILE